MNSYKAGLADPLPEADWLDGAHGRKIAFKAYPAQHPWLHVLISHGYGEHIGWYEHVAKSLQEQGISAYVFDHYYHGRSWGRPADVPDYEELIAGLRVAVEQGVQPYRERAQAGAPLILMGHSNGALISVLSLEAMAPGPFSGLILASPFLGFPPGFQRLMLPVVNLLSLILPRGRLPMEGRPEFRTSDKSVWPDYRRDPLRFRAISIRFVRAMGRGIRRAWREPSCQGLPLLIIFGDQDRVVDLASVRRWFDRVASSDKAMRPYPGLRHELLQESDWRSVLQDTADWMRSRFA